MTPTREQIQAALDSVNEEERIALLAGFPINDDQNFCTIRAVLQAALDDQADMTLAYMVGHEKGKDENRIPEGYKLVPLEPTDEMLDAHNEVSFGDLKGDKAAHKAMLDAAPTPTGEKK